MRCYRLRRALALALLATTTGCADDVPPQTPPPAGAMLQVATYNLYLGADLTRLVDAPLDPDQVRQAAIALFQDVQASDPEARMDAVAGQLAEAAPDVVGLQEAVLWRTQVPGDGSATPAGTVLYDFLDLLVQALARRGLGYRVVVVADNADIEASASIEGVVTDVRFTDRDAILLREGSPVAVVATNSGKFTSNLEVPLPELGTVRFARGWVLADLETAGGAVRVVGTHLEAVAEPIRDAQAIELLAGPADPTAVGELVLVGDFNLPPGSAAYDALAAANLADVWTSATLLPADPGFTCCRDADLRNPESLLSERIDFVFTRGAFRAASVRRLGETPADRTADGLWPSDHAGVGATLTAAP